MAISARIRARLPCSRRTSSFSLSIVNNLAGATRQRTVQFLGRTLPLNYCFVGIEVDARVEEGGGTRGVSTDVASVTLSTVLGTVPNAEPTAEQRSDISPCQLMLDRVAILWEPFAETLGKTQRMRARSFQGING